MPGAAGSPTWVAELRSAGLERSGTVISGEDPEEAARRLTEYMVDKGLFQVNRRGGSSRPRRSVPTTADPTKAIWVVAELVADGLRPVTYELLGAAQELADALGGEVGAILMGSPSVVSHTGALGAYGADTVHLLARITHTSRAPCEVAPRIPELA